MTLPVSGAISFNAINVELGVAGTTTADINQASYRTLAGVPSGQISLSNFYGKSNRTIASATISANTANYVLNTAKASGYVAGKTDMTLTINSGVYISSASTGSYAFTVDTSWAAGDTVTIVNSGVIVGRGGNGGVGAYTTTGGTGTAAGPALLVQRATSINNINSINGGGGGGGGGAYTNFSSGKVGYSYPGGGGGGGIGGSTGGGTNGGPGATAGSNGTLTSVGAGGSGANTGGGGIGGDGGSGGTYGSTGLAGGTGIGAISRGAGAGGAAGSAVVGNVNITWIATGTRNGPIS